MSTFSVSKTLHSLQKVWQPQTQFVRFRYWKQQKSKPTIYRYGYKDDHFSSGLLPRDRYFNRVSCLPIYKPKDSWSWKKRIMGQNDYIDILGKVILLEKFGVFCTFLICIMILFFFYLGDEKLHPAKICPGVPEWLRGFRGNEYLTLMRKFKTFNKSLPYQQPRKWDKMQTRFEQLYYYFNYRKKIR